MALPQNERGFWVLARLVQAITASLELDEVLESVVRAAIHLVPDSSARIWVTEGERLVLRAEAGTLDPPSHGRERVLDRGEGLTGRVAAAQEPLMVDDVLADPRTVHVGWLREQGFVSYIGLPLLVRDQLVGVLSLNTRHLHRFSADESEVLTSFGAHAAIAINNARLFAETQARRRAAETLARVARTLTESLDVATVGERIVASIPPLFDVPYSVLRLIQPDGSLVAIASGGAARSHFTPGHVQRPGTGLVGRAVTERRPVWSRDVLAQPDLPFADELRALIQKSGIRAFLAAPLLARGEIIGVLAIGDGAPREFSQSEVTLLETFADQAALALENARLYEEVRDARDFLRSIAWSSADAIVTTDVDGRITFWSPGAEQMFGYRSPEVLGQPITEYFRSGDEERKDLLRQLASEERILNYETTVHAREGRSLDVSASVSLLRDASATTVGTVRVLRDVTERKRGEAARLRHLEEISRLSQQVQARETFIRSVLESLREGLVVLDSDGRVVTWNRAMEEIYGLAAAAVQGEPYQRVFAGLGARLSEPLERLRRGDMEEFALEGVEHKNLRNERRVLNLKGSLLTGRRAPAGAALLMEDITDRVALTQAARQAEKMAAVGTLCAGIAHEVNNPIGIITSRIELMLMDAKTEGLPVQLLQDLGVLHRNAQRVGRIAQALLSFARQSPAELAPVDLSRVVQDTLVLVESQLAKDRIWVVTAVEPALPLLQGDANALQQVLLNLLTNSREAMAEGGEIRIELGRVSRQPDRIRLAVTDTGPGIAAEDLPSIFDPFFTTKPHGTGLGLSMSYAIIRDHGATVDVQSEPGKGTTFVLTFPAL